MEHKLTDRYCPVLIVWEDFAIKGGWHSPRVVRDSMKGPYLVETVGFMVASNKDRIVLAVGFSIHGDGYQEIMTIPRGMVKSVHYLGVRHDTPKIIKQARRAEKIRSNRKK
jgi:hypothetical protein